MNYKINNHAYQLNRSTFLDMKRQQKMERSDSMQKRSDGACRPRTAAEIGMNKKETTK